MSYTIRDLLKASGLALPSEELEELTGQSYEDQAEHLKDLVGFKLNDIFGVGEVTGGADWSAAHVWRVPADLEQLITRRRIKGELFLIWSEGDLYDSLYFVERTEDRDGDFVLDEIDVELSPALERRLSAARDLPAGFAMITRDEMAHRRDYNPRRDRY
jgi:hypothetical protein